MPSLSSAPGPSAASPTTSRSGCAPRIITRPVRTRSWSSATTTRMLTPDPPLEERLRRSSHPRNPGRPRRTHPRSWTRSAESADQVVSYGGKGQRQGVRGSAARRPAPAATGHDWVTGAGPEVGGHLADLFLLLTGRSLHRSPVWARRRSAAFRSGNASLTGDTRLVRCGPRGRRPIRSGRGRRRGLRCGRGASGMRK